MILGDSDDTAETSGPRSTLDDIFRQAAVRHPRAIALADPLDRARVTDGMPRRLSYAETDRLVSALATRLRGLGLQTDAVIAMQLPNTVESVIAFLGILRAGMIAAPLPLLWRKADIAAALGRVSAKAFITAARIGDTAHAELAMQTAAELFSIRHIGVFGNAPDGTVPLDALFSVSKDETQPPVARAGNPASHVALITFDVAGDGIVPVARNHAQLIAGGLGPLLEGRIATDATILSAMPIGSFAGTVLTLMPWLLSGGTLALHHPFDLESFAAQRRALHCDALVLPGPLVAPLAEDGYLAGENLKTILSFWRMPERLDLAPQWTSDAALVDIMAFGEIGLIAARRDADGVPEALQPGAIGAPRGFAGAMPVIDIDRSENGTLVMRGPMVPLHAFPPGTDLHLKTSADGFVDTGYGCKFEADGKSLAITRLPAGLIGVGGYRFVVRKLDALMRECAPGGTVFALPDALTGQRFAGTAPDRAAAATELTRRGQNPLITGAFRSAKTAVAA